MQLLKRKKAGYTLVEVLVVVTIIGVLSSMGVVSLQGAVANSRVKDAATNTAAFLERVANLSKQQSVTVCLLIDNTDPRRLLAQKSKGDDCSSANKYDTQTIDQLVIDSPSKFVKNTSSSCNFVGDVDITQNSDAVIKPRLGLSAVPHGVVCIQDGVDHFGLARKTKDANTVKAFWKVGNADGAKGWLEL